MEELSGSNRKSGYRSEWENFTRKKRTKKYKIEEQKTKPNKPKHKIYEQTAATIHWILWRNKNIDFQNKIFLLKVDFNR